MIAIFKGKAYGAVTVGGRGQLVIPSQLRKALNIKSGDQLMVFALPDKKVINLMPSEDFSLFLERVGKDIARLEKRVSSKRN